MLAIRLMLSPALLATCLAVPKIEATTLLFLLVALAAQVADKSRALVGLLEMRL